MPTQVMAVQSVTSGRLLGASVNLNTPGHYLHWGFVQISVANGLVIAIMVLVFLAAVLVPFPRRRQPPR